MSVTLKLISSLETVFPKQVLRAPVWDRCTVLQGEKLHFQIAYRFPNTPRSRLALNIQTDSDFGDAVQLYHVANVPVRNPMYTGIGNHFLTEKPSLLPDPLLPWDGHITYKHRIWSALWCEVDIKDMRPGMYPIYIRATDETTGKPCAQVCFTVEVLDARLPEQTLLCTNWLHGDCLATQYGVPVFSEMHWQLLGNYIENAVNYGMNMLLTPLFTPPLDTQIGKERPTVQLVEITDTPDGYAFDFSRLERFMTLAESKGIRYFEMSHLFTQWGAYHAPKIVVSTAQGEETRFGWHTDSTAPEYTQFLHAFLTALKAFLKARGCWERCWFHLSDEPGKEHLDNYRKVLQTVRPILEDAHCMDALSSYAFYEEKLVSTPVVATDYIETFLENKVPDLWAYYCCCQVQDVSNRLIATSGARNRILGWQLYRWNISGFLHWGYNFWYSALSRHAINPWICNDSDGTYPAGDPFIVYPGADGAPINALRLHVFYDALQDMRALQLLQQKWGQEKVQFWLDSRTDGPMTFQEYPRDAQWILETRDALNRAIAACE